MSNPEVGSYDKNQDACPKCGESDNLSDVPDDDGLFSTCHECEYQWHEPSAPRTYL
jgi:hypothetical protein